MEALRHTLRRRLRHPDPRFVCRRPNDTLTAAHAFDARDEVHPRHRENFRVLEPLDFLAEISAHIPDAHEEITLLYGWYSNRTRGYRKQQSARSMRWICL